MWSAESKQNHVGILRVSRFEVKYCVQSKKASLCYIQQYNYIIAVFKCIAFGKYMNLHIIKNNSKCFIFNSEIMTNCYTYMVNLSKGWAKKEHCRGKENYHRPSKYGHGH